MIAIFTEKQYKGNRHNGLRSSGLTNDEELNPIA